jgi:hypothetical protein
MISEVFILLWLGANFAELFILVDLAGILEAKQGAIAHDCMEVFIP